MARTKKDNLKPVAKDPKSVKHGCCSCVHKDTDAKKFPCSECMPNWYYWEDSNPDIQAIPMMATEPKQPENVAITSQKRGRQKTAK